jgi:hypothetical protein
MHVVKIVRQSKKYNPHINNVGEIARVDKEWDDGLCVCTTTGGVGNVDKNAVVDIEFDSLSSEQKYLLETRVGIYNNLEM